MIRFLSHLFKLGYDPCKSCEVLKQQLLIANEEKKQAYETLLNLLKPKVYESAPTQLEAVTPKVGLWSKRRALLEEQDRETARIQKQSNLIAAVDRSTQTNSSVEELEHQLGLEEVK